MQQIRRFTEEEAKSLKRKAVRAKDQTLVSVEEGTYGLVTIVDPYGWGARKNEAGVLIFQWQVGVKWDSDDEEEEPVYDWFEDETFYRAVAVVSAKERNRGGSFTKERVHQLIGTRVQVKVDVPGALLKKGMRGTVVSVENKPEYLPGNDYVMRWHDRWFVHIAWDDAAKGMESFDEYFFRRWLTSINE